MVKMAPLNRKVLFNLPNILTYARIGCIPVIVLLMLQIGPQNSFALDRLYCSLAAILFILAGISDLIDGHLARKYGMVSVLGRFVDPMADKLIHMAVMVMMVELGWLPAWLVIVLLFREIFINGLRAVAAGEGIIISAREWGKKKTAWMNVGLSAFLIHYPLLGLSAYTVGWVCLSVGALYNIISGIQYTFAFLKEIKQE